MQRGKYRSAEAAATASLSVSVAVEEGILRRRIAAALASDGLTVHIANGRPSTRAAGVVVLARDISPGERVPDLRTEIKALGPAPIVIVSPRAGGPAARRALRDGAHALVFDNEIEDALGPVVRAVAADQTCIPHRVRLALDRPKLSYREREVLRLAVTGRTNREIASKLYLAESTVKSHLSSAFRRLGVRSRGEAASLVLDPAEGLGPLILGSPGQATANGSAGAASANGS